MAAKSITDKEIIEAVHRHGSITAAARALGRERKNISRRYKTIASYHDRMEIDGQRPDVDPGMLEAATEAGLSLDTAKHGWRRIERDDGGFDSVFWKQDQDEETLQSKADAILESLRESIDPVAPVKRSQTGDSELLNLFVLTDAHIGMLAWHEETDEDWDTQMAEEVIVRWFGEAISRAPKAKRAVFAELGDLLHSDSLEALTPASKNVLDADSRYAKVVRVAIRIMRQIISMLLKQYDEVDVIVAEGNHNPSGAIWCREMLAALYAEEPRLTVDQSPKPFYCVEHGDTSLFFHHGHQVKIGELDRVMASEFREIFGRTKHSFAHMGHLHHREKESQLMVVEQHRTLAARDAHGARHGYNAGTDASCITYHKSFGEVGRVTVSKAMVE